MLREAADLGFRRMELSHGVRMSLIPGILKGLEAGVMRIGTCHNFCPLPPGVLHASPNLYQPTASDPREVDQWVRHTRKSIDFAKVVGAGVLVCHLGSVEFFWFHPGRRIARYMDEHERPDYRSDEQFVRLREAGLARLRRKQAKHLSVLSGALGRVLEYAHEKGIKLAFENRERFEELPLDDGFESLLANLPPDAPVGYWHDCGHADIKEKMGLIDPIAHLGRLAPRLLGFHLHDVSTQGDDHQELGSGRIDFEALKAFWRPSHHYVLELSPRLTPLQVSRSKERVERLLCSLA